jgi:dihydroneopterin aldolase
MTESHGRVFVRGLTVQAAIGVHSHEHGRMQTLVVDVELEVAGEIWRSIHDTVNYERVADHAQALADSGHILLVETFAWRLAQVCLAEPHVISARVRVEKPAALSPHAAAAGVEIRLARSQTAR